VKFFPDRTPIPKMGIRLDTRALARGFICALTACVSGCAVGPDYRKPEVRIPGSFKEGADWERAQPKPADALSNTWWRVYQDGRLAQLIEQSLQANQSIVAAEAAYRLAQATVQANTASLFPVVSAALSGSRTGAGAGAVARGAVTAPRPRASTTLSQQRFRRAGSRICGRYPSPDRIGEVQRAGERRAAGR